MMRGNPNSFTSQPIIPMSDMVPDDAPQTFECSLALLQQIVHELEEGNLGLETSLARFEDGIRLLRSCYQILEKAEQKIEVLTGVDADGNLMTEPFDAKATFEGGEKPAKKPGRRRAPSKPDANGGQEPLIPPADPTDGQRLF
jgi:exodeoxyribonuclease VII small subunit